MSVVSPQWQACIQDFNFVRFMGRNSRASGFRRATAWIRLCAVAKSSKSDRPFLTVQSFLGELFGVYLLRSESIHHITDRTVQKLDKLSATMVESGLFQFYISFKKYQEKRATMRYVQHKHVNIHVYYYNLAIRISHLWKWILI